MYQITPLDLGIGFIPVLLTLIIIFYWSHNFKTSLIAIFRMLIQLLLIGYALNYIFYNDSQWVILLVLVFMLVMASWISLNALPVAKKPLLIFSFGSILCGGGLNLFFVSQGVLHAEPWYQPQVMIPIAGMIFSNSMNAISLA
ncbi:MAG: ABC transporter permease, partial [Gammaproteobacteria bacterium]|nr:ABC transporter permease [Gammaproteobacteria bacterium]